MTYSSLPFKEGDVVECISDKKPEFYSRNWTELAGIKVGDKLTVSGCWKNGVDGFGVLFEECDYVHAASLFKLVEPDGLNLYIAGHDPYDDMDASLQFAAISQSDKRINVEKLPFPDEFLKNLERMRELYSDVKLWTSPSDRLDAAMKFLETSGDVVQALKIAAGLNQES